MAWASVLSKTALRKATDTTSTSSPTALRESLGVVYYTFGTCARREGSALYVLASYSNMARGKRYTEAERSAALAALTAAGGDTSRVSRDLGIPRSTLRAWRDQGEPEQVPDARRDLARLVLEAATSMARTLPSHIEGAGLRDLSVSLGILIDKLVLLEGNGGASSGSGPGVVAVLLPDNGRLTASAVAPAVSP